MVAAVAPEPDSPDHVRTVKVKALLVDDNRPEEFASAMSPTFVDDIDLSRAQRAMMYAVILLPIATFLGIYSAMGEGIAVYGALSEDGNYEVAWYLCVAAVAWLALMWVVDAFDKSITNTNVKKARSEGRRLGN